MTKPRIRGQGHCVRRLLSGLALFACCSTAARGTNNISGSVRNQTRGEPAARDVVTLVRLDRDMQVEARAKTDAQGAFTLHVQYPNRPNLVRVFHQGVSYDRQASAGETLSLEVFDAAPRVRGVAGSIEILHIGNNGNLLPISDLVEIENESSPPVTRVGERTFEVYLPATAKIDSVLAAGPVQIGALISAALVPGEAGNYAVNFPLRPGATEFAFNYDLPYDGDAAFQTRHAYPLQQLAIMISPAMKSSSRSRAFKILATGDSRYQVQAANQLAAGEGPAFEVSGTGALPPLVDQSKSHALPRSAAVPDRIVSAPDRGALPIFWPASIHA